MLTENNQMARNEDFVIQLTSHMLYDKLQTLSAEYSLSVEFLVNVAVQRLVEDVEFVRSLRAGTAKLGYPEYKRAREKMIELLTAKNNVERILGVTEKEKNRDRQQEAR